MGPKNQCILIAGFALFLTACNNNYDFNAGSGGLSTASGLPGTTSIAPTTAGTGSSGNPSGVGSGTPTIGGPTAGGGTTVSVQQFQPALAVRDISCLACHANIQANVITDFGNSNGWFLNGFNASTSFGSYHYTATTWQTLESIVGQVFVPQVSVPASYVQPQMSGATLATPSVGLDTYLTQTATSNFGGSWYSYFAETTPATFSYTNSVQAPVGQPAVVDQPNIYIGAPTVQEILAIVPAVAATAPWVQVVGQSAAGLTGLTATVGVNGTSFIETTGPVNCAGQDVVINGTLLIENGQFYAGKNGCRLYVTGSIFVQGQITYLDAATDSSANLQITSAVSIIMGVGLNGSALNGDGSTDNSGSSPLQVRLIDDVRGAGNFLPMRGTPDSASYGQYANSIMAEANNIGVQLLQDASVPGSAAVAASAAKQLRASINFENILLNAPLIHSRYMGLVSGVIVAESAMFSLGEFRFQYAPVFKNVPILPALPYDILCTNTPCNPANNL